MNCREFQDVLQDVARDAGLDVTILKDALEHAEACGSCDDLLGEAEALTANLRSLAAIDASRQAPQAIEITLMEALHQNEAFRRNKLPTPRTPNLRIATVASLMGIAALLLFAIVLARRWQPAPSPEGARPSSPESPASRPSNAPQEASVGEPRLPPGTQVDTQADALSAFDDEEAAANSFVPLTNTFDPNALEGGAVLRVSVPRRTLQTFGLSVEQNAAEPVLADMVVTSDGTPQAIRLVGR